MFGSIWHRIWTTILKIRINGPISAIFFNLHWKWGNLWHWNYKCLLDFFVTRAHSGYIWSFYRHNKYRCMQKLRADQARKRKNMTFYLLQNTRNLQHVYMRSPILAVTLHAALENGNTVPAGCYLKLAELQYVSFAFRCRVIIGSLMRLY